MTTKPGARALAHELLVNGAQLGGFAAVGAGLYMLAGLAWTLVLCGLVVVAVGALTEARGSA